MAKKKRKVFSHGFYRKTLLQAKAFTENLLAP